MVQLQAALGFILRSGKRIAVLVVGVVLIAGGLVMIVTPGPGLLLIIAGLAVLATEFAWAERMLDKAKEKAGQAKDAVLKRRPSAEEPASPEP
jgi:uncharacterized protein (TIGR02611 family)